jgi:hypothetical protein
VADTTASERSVPKSPRPLQTSMGRRYPYLTGACAVLLLAGALTIGYSIGWHFSKKSIENLKNSLATKTVEYNNKVSELRKQKADDASLTKDLSETKAKLDEIFKSTRQINLTANKAESVSIGDFTVGLATALGSGSVSVNINGRQRNMAPADKETLTFDCLIELQSFDVLSSSATFNTSCSPAKPPDTTAK